MATMNISLPDKMKDWIEEQTADGRYANSSDYFRDLVRRDQDRVKANAWLQREIDDGLASGISDRTPEQLRAYASARADEAMKKHGLADDRTR
jgi:antitoxin ParD1/3/4